MDLEYHELCTPAKIYLILSVFSIISWALFSNGTKNSGNKSSKHHFSIMALCFKVLIMILWTKLLNWLCSKGHTTVAWLVLCLPILLPLLVVFLIAAAII